MNLADLVGIYGRDRNRLNPVAFTAGNDERFSLVIESVAAAKQVWNYLSMDHAITALRVRNLLSAHSANLIAHVTINYSPHHGHPGNVVHPVANEKHRLCH